MSHLSIEEGSDPSDAGCLEDDTHTCPSQVRPGVMAVILSAASGLIISTNLLVAAAVLKMLLKKSSQSWCFVLNLALADFLVGVAITGLAVEDFSMDGDTQKLRRLVSANPSVHSASPEGKSRCLMRMVLVMSPCTASMMSMFFISLDRYAAIKMPLRYSQLCGKGTTAGSLLVLWVSSLMIGFLPVMVQQLQTDSYDGFCSFFAVIRKVCMVIFSMCFFPVLSVFVYIYLDILKIACSHHKQIGLIRRVGSRTTDQRAGPRGHHHQQPRSCFWNHAKALRTVALLVGCFLVLWCPFFVVGMVELLCSGCRLTNVLQNYLWLLGLSNSMINPLVYAFWQKEVRLQLAAMFSCFTGRLLAAGTPSVAERRILPSVVAVAFCVPNDAHIAGSFFVPTYEQGQRSRGTTTDQHQLSEGPEGPEGSRSPQNTTSFKLKQDRKTTGPGRKNAL